jgi:hypothetical protein
MTEQEEKEKVLVPVRRLKREPKQEEPEDPPEPVDIKPVPIPRRWQVFK